MVWCVIYQSSSLDVDLTDDFSGISLQVHQDHTYYVRERPNVCSKRSE
jgi:hypothetical protein